MNQRPGRCCWRRLLLAARAQRGTSPPPGPPEQVSLSAHPIRRGRCDRLSAAGTAGAGAPVGKGLGLLPAAAGRPSARRRAMLRPWRPAGGCLRTGPRGVRPAEGQTGQQVRRRRHSSRSTTKPPTSTASPTAVHSASRTVPPPPEEEGRTSPRSRPPPGAGSRAPAGDTSRKGQRHQHHAGGDGGHLVGNRCHRRDRHHEPAVVLVRGRGTAPRRRAGCRSVTMWTATVSYSPQPIR